MAASMMEEAVVLLAAAVLAVPLFKRLRLGAVLGYLVAGLVIGPWLTGLVRDVDSILHFSELGVVLLLFVIGLELQPARLWALRGPVFGLGSAQLFATGLVFTVAALALGLALAPALVVGLSLALSSTALALQLLAERKALATHHGRAAFAILLFQDLAAIPLLAVLPALGDGGGWQWLTALRALVTVALIVLVGRRLLRPYFRLAASAGSHEVFVAASLLVVVGTAWAMQQAGLSMALGAFVAGVLLADSEYRHELEADIEPFKGLLLGLFFIAIGMSVDVSLVLERPALIAGLALALVGTKAAILYGVGRAARASPASAASLALAAAQGGEFAFVLFGVAAAAHVLDKAVADLLTVVVAVSMAITPLMLALADRWLKAAPAQREFDRELPQDHRVIIAGFGRFGQMVARMLRMKKIPFTALEASFEQVDFVRKFGNKIYFGDASRIELLRAARADRAEVFVLAIDDIEASVRTAEVVRRHYPHLKIYARARNRVHAYRLMDAGVDRLIRETLLSSLELARDVLVALGFARGEAQAAVDLFRSHDDALLAEQHAVYRDEAQLIASSRAGAAELERLFGQDAAK